MNELILIHIDRNRRYEEAAYYFHIAGSLHGYYKTEFEARQAAAIELRKRFP